MMHFTGQEKPCPSCRLLRFQCCGIGSSTGSVVDWQSIRLPSGAEPTSTPREAPSVRGAGEQAGCSGLEMGLEPGQQTLPPT